MNVCRKPYCKHTICQLEEGHSGECKVEWDNHNINYCDDIKCQLSVGHGGMCEFKWNSSKCNVVRENGIQPSRQCLGTDGHTDPHKYPNDTTFSHYVKDVTKLKKLDVYRVLELFEVKSPAIQHAIKKLLAAGKGGSKSMEKDIEEAIISLERWQDMRSEENE